MDLQGFMDTWGTFPFFGMAVAGLYMVYRGLNYIMRRREKGKRGYYQCHGKYKRWGKTVYRMCTGKHDSNNCDIVDFAGLVGSLIKGYCQRAGNRKKRGEGPF